MDRTGGEAFRERVEAALASSPELAAAVDLCLDMFGPGAVIAEVETLSQEEIEERRAWDERTTKESATPRPTTARSATSSAKPKPRPKPVAKPKKKSPAPSPGAEPDLFGSMGRNPDAMME